MKKDRLYFLTFASITLLYAVIGSIALHFLIRSSTSKILETHLEFSKKEAKVFASLVSYQLENGIEKEKVIQNVQSSFEATDFQIGFLSMVDWSGRFICHPDIKEVGQQVSATKSFVTSVVDNLNAETFYQQYFEVVGSEGTLEELNNNLSGVVHLSTVEGSDWVVAAHAGMNAIAMQIDGMKRRFYTIFAIMGLIVILSYVALVRMIGSTYERRLELKNQQLEDEVINLSKLNRAVGDYQQRVSEQVEKAEEEKEVEEDTIIDSENGTVVATKKRILTYVRNELVPIATQEIAHIYTENTITYVTGFDGRRSTTNSSLDELYSQLDNSMFFRANRQFIIAISSIDKIVKYGNNQLKILVNPSSETNIIISKNKAAEFKQWLNL